MADNDSDISKILPEFNSVFPDWPTTDNSNNTANSSSGRPEAGSLGSNCFDAQAKDEGQLFPESDPQNMTELFDLLSSDPSWLDYCLDSSVASLEQELFALHAASSPETSANASTDSNSIDTLLSVQTFVRNQQQMFQDAQQLNTSRVEPSAQATTTASPINYALDASTCQPCTTVDSTFGDDARYQQVLEPNSVDTKRIRIRSHPRRQFRPRTENESRNSSHYIRCEEGCRPEYPTVDVPHEWSYQSDMNIIEVALVGLDKEPHPYTLDNKTSSPSFDPNALIFKQEQRNVLFFRLTEEDFRNGYKTFLIEYIKNKQDDVITKEMIRTRQLDQSMLRFTRILRLGKDNFIRDETTTQYSAVMQEAYGDVEVEHMGPRYGPMHADERIYALLKGRILKSDLTIRVHEPQTNWNQEIKEFTKSGNVIYFFMPPFPYQAVDRVTAYISIYYKENPIHRSPYQYNVLLDKELEALRLDDSSSAVKTTSTKSMSNAIDFFSATGALPVPSGRRRSSTKSTKRLAYSSLK